MRLVDVLKTQNEWWKSGCVPNALLKETKREEFSKAIKFLSDERIISIIGPRRTGKTTLLYQVIQYLLKNGLESKRVLFFSADDPSLRPYSKSLFENIFNTYFEEILIEEKRKEKVYIFIDEVHFYDGWEHWLKKYYDMGYLIKFIVSSSSSAHLSTRSRESLVGRIIEILLLPLNFRSYLYLLRKDEIIEHYEHYIKFIEPAGISFKDGDLNSSIKNNFELLKYEQELKILFSKYLLWGGLPESMKEKEIVLWQEKLISDVLRKVIYRDIVELYYVRTPSKLEDLFVHLSYNSSNTFSYSSLSKNLGMSIESVMNYITYLLESYLIGELKLFSKSIEKTLRSNRKFFIMDSGLQNSITRTTDLTEINVGLLVESVVQKHLFVFAKLNNYNVYYWREKEEVDIVLDTRSAVLPYEVKYKTKIKKDDIKGLLKFMNEFKIETGFVVTRDVLEKQVIDGKHIVLIPAWLFLLSL